jgi:dienelactone hydrolase
MQLSPSLAHAEARKSISAAMSYVDGPFEAWREKARRKLIDLIGLPRVQVPKPIATSIWKRDHALGTIEKLTFPVEPGNDAVAYWCVPHGAKRPYPTYICLQGHSSGMHNSINTDYDEATPVQAEGDRDFAIGCMRRGIAALCIEQRGFGYRREFDLPGRVKGTTTCQDPMTGALLIGRTLIGERVWDVDRGIDYLASRGDVDMHTLGILGNSGGGTTSLYSLVLLDRLNRAIVSCAFARFADSIAAMRHCCCNVIPGIMNHFDMADIVGMAAPKRVVIVNGVTDDIFPIESARSQFEHARHIYVAGGAAGRVKLVEGPEGHRFYANLSWSAMQSLG